jgi:hypothetical protein
VSCIFGIQITVTIKNISGATQSLDGKTINLKVYPMSNPALLPVNLQPLRTEGKTNMRPVPVNDDIPNFYLFHDTDTNEYLYWDKRTNTWTTNPFTV